MMLAYSLIAAIVWLQYTTEIRLFADCNLSGIRQNTLCRMLLSANNNTLQRFSLSSAKHSVCIDARRVFVERQALGET
jgi:hypothetical protein